MTSQTTSNSSNPSPPSTSDDTYMLSRNYMASNRLTTQHYVLQSRYGWLIHPKITQSLTTTTASSRPAQPPTSPPSSSPLPEDHQPLRIAEVAAGNCIWATSLPSTLHTRPVEIVAFDLSPSQFPPAWTLPPHISTEQYDLFTPVPPQYQGYFDIVHLRLIIAAVAEKGYSIVLDNLISMLKPGGWLQWEEPLSPFGYEPINPTTLEPEVSFKPPRFIEIVGENSNVMRTMRFTERLADILRNEGGLVDVEDYRALVKPELLKREGELFLWIYQELGMGMGRSGNCSEQVMKEYMESIDAEAEEMGRGKMWAHKFVVAVGRKGI